MAHRPLRVMIVLPQDPDDPASGAARSMRTIGRFLHRFADHEVVCLGTTANEGGSFSDRSARRGGRARRRVAPVVNREDDSGSTALLDVGDHDQSSWDLDRDLSAAFDRLVEARACRLAPDVVLTYGGSPAHRRRIGRLRKAGARTVLMLHNFGYDDARAFEHFDAVWACSPFLATWYGRRHGVEMRPMPLPIEPAEVVAAEREAVFTTMVNPTPDKGLFVVARLAEMLGSERPDIPVMIVEARAGAGALVAAGRKGGFDLTRHGSIMVTPCVAEAREVYAVTRTVLVPSVWEEPAGRVPAEAMLNGIVPLVSNRGGLSETVGSDRFVVPIDRSITLERRCPVDEAAARPWFEAVTRLVDDEAAYAEASAAAAAGAARFDAAAVAAVYDEAATALVEGAG